jgi:P pilus assembly chaperone PapD
MTSRMSGSARRRGRAFALVVVALAGVARTASSQISVDELELRIPLKRGATTMSDVFHVTNSAVTPTQATISTQDWDRSERGENRYYPLGTMPNSCGSRVKVFPSVLQLGPRSTQTVRVTIDSAASIQTGCYAILFVETPPPPRTANGPALVYTIRYGVKIYVERDVALAAEVEDMVVASPEPRPASGAPGNVAGAPKQDTTLKQVVITYRNTGGRQTLTHGTIEVRRADNSLVTKVDVAEFPTLPGATRRLGVTLPRLERGKYVLLALLDYEGAEIAAAQVELEIP